MKHVRIAMVQMNATVGDIQGNTTKILQGIQQAKDVQADIVTFPELAITGYPPQDLLLKPQFLQENRAALDRILDATQDLTIAGSVNIWCPQVQEYQQDRAFIIKGRCV